MQTLLPQERRQRESRDAGSGDQRPQAILPLRVELILQLGGDEHGKPPDWTGWSTV